MTDAPQCARTAGGAARRWLATMPGQVAGQRRLLESLITTAENEPAFRWLEVGGSLARGTGDELSDIDAGLGGADDGWDEGLAAAADLLELVTGKARSVLPFEPPDGLRAWVRRRLASPGAAGGGGS